MSDEAQRLFEALSQLDDNDRATLVAFAEFLCQRAGRAPAAETGEQPAAAAAQPAAEAPLPEPEPIPRPEEERVVAAIRRLSRTYYMIDKNRMLDATSSLVAQHVVGGRDAREVIDELEAAFQAHYETWKSERSGD